MSRLIPLNLRQAHDAETAADIEIVLFHIDHPDLDATIRLTTDPTERLSIDPPMFGTRSRWMTSGDSPFLWAGIAVLMPDDQEDSPPTAQIVVSALDGTMAAALRSTTGRATVAIGVGEAADPDGVITIMQDMSVVAAEGDAGTVQLTLAFDALAAEPWPSMRMSRERFPALYR